MGVCFGNGLIDLPEELLQKHEAGELVFFCGAGISVPAGLPDFNKLVRKLSRRFINIVGKRFYAKKDSPEDFLFYMEQKLGFDSRLREELAKCLTRSAIGDAYYHRSILKLSKGRDGQVRIVTTNFDRLFNKAIKEIGFPPIKSYVYPNLPSSLEDGGIAYIHGKLPKSRYNDLNNLVVTSADFGRAYLTDGGVNRFLIKLLNDYTICFVGYSAEDKIMKFILDAWAAEQRRRKEYNKIYAFVGCSPETMETERVKWIYKGVEPILYSDVNKHEQLRKTLDVWAERHENGTLGKSWNINDILNQSPSIISKSQIAALYFDLCDVDAAYCALKDRVSGSYDVQWIEQMLSSTLNDVKCLTEFKVKKVFQSLEYQFSLFYAATTNDDFFKKWFSSKCAFNFDASRLATVLCEWICQFVHEESLFRLVSFRLDEMSTRFLSRLKEAVAKSNKITDWLRYAWELGFRGLFANKYDEVTVLLQEVNQDLDILADSYLPKVVVLFEEDKIDFEVKVPLNFYLRERERLLLGNCDGRMPMIPSMWLGVLMDYLKRVVELDVELKKNLSEKKYYSCFNAIPHAVEPHEQNRICLGNNLVQLIALLRESWLSLLREAPQKAREVALEWAHSKGVVWHRLFLFAASQPNLVITLEEWCNFLLKDCREDYRAYLLNPELFHEIMVLFRVKFDELHALENKCYLDKLKEVLANDPKPSSLADRLLGQLEQKRLRTQDIRWDRGEFLSWSEFTGDKYVAADNERIQDAFLRDRIAFFTQAFTQNSCENDLLDTNGQPLWPLESECDHLWYKTVCDEEQRSVVKAVLNHYRPIILLSPENVDSVVSVKYFSYLRTALFNWEDERYSDYTTYLSEHVKAILDGGGYIEEIKEALIHWCKKYAKLCRGLDLLERVLDKVCEIASNSSEWTNDTPIAQRLNHPVVKIVDVLITYLCCHVEDAEQSRVLGKIEKLMKVDTLQQAVYCACFYNYAICLKLDYLWTEKVLMSRLSDMADASNVDYWRYCLWNWHMDVALFNEKMKRSFWGLCNNLSNLKSEQDIFLKVFIVQFLIETQGRVDKEYCLRLEEIVRQVSWGNVLNYLLQQLKMIENVEKRLLLYRARIDDLFIKIAATIDEVDLSLSNLLGYVVLLPKGTSDRSRLFNRLFETSNTKITISFSLLSRALLQDLTDEEFLCICKRFQTDIVKSFRNNVFRGRIKDVKIEDISDRELKRVYSSLMMSLKE